MFKNHPKGLLTAALSNMGERFGYYIMNAVLVLFLCSKFGLSEAASGTIYSFFYAGIYILSIACTFLIRASIDLGLVGIVLLEFVVPYGMAELIVYLKKRGQNYELHGN